MNAYIECKDAVLWLESLEDESIDLIITDPPYESLEKHRSIGTTTRLSHSKSSSNDWFEIFPNGRFNALFRECFRVLRNNSHLYFFCDQETLFIVKPIAEQAGFRFWKPLIWDKVTMGMGYHYRCRYEFILFFEKGKRKLNNLAIPDVLVYKRIRNGFPTEKPYGLIETLVLQSSSENNLVIDPFMGSGTTLLAAVNNKRQAMGVDVSEKAFYLTKNRLSNILN